MNTDDRYQRAKERVVAKRGFFAHLTVYVGVMALLAVIDLAAGANIWFHWPLLGWGIGVLVHAFMTFGPGPSPITDEMIQKEMEREESLV